MNDIEKNKLVEKRHLSNGVVISVFDQSRKIAGDRWYVRYLCEAAIPRSLFEDFLDNKQEGDEGLTKYIQSRLEEAVLHRFIKEKHFVAVTELDAIKDEFISQIMRTALSYLSKPVYPEKFVEKTYEKLKKKWMLEKQNTQRDISDPLDDIDDFSSCFVD